MDTMIELPAMRRSAELAPNSIDPETRSVEVIWSTPEMVPSLRSSGAATVAAITEGSAPGRDADTRIIGKSTLGTDDTGRNP